MKSKYHTSLRENNREIKHPCENIIEKENILVRKQQKDQHSRAKTREKITRLCEKKTEIRNVIKQQRNEISL